MKSKAIHFLLIQLILFIGCTEKKNTNTVTLDVINFDQRLNYSIIKYDIISFEENVFLPVDTVKTDNLSFQIPVTSSILTALKIGDSFFPLFLEPGFNLTLVHSFDSLKALKFSGEGSEVNNQINQLNSLYQLYYSPELGELEPREFLAKMDIIQSKAASVYEKFDKQNFNDISMQLFETKMAARRMNYYNKDSEIPKELKAVSKQVLEYPRLLEVGSIDHSVTLNMYMLKEIHPQLWDPSYAGNDSLKMLFPSKVDNYIKRSSFDDQLKEILRAKNIYLFLSHFGETPTTTKIYNQFKDEYEKSKYLSTLTAKYEELSGFSKGDILPNLEMKSTKDEIVSLGDLKGKIIYLDIWTTWCKPCIEKFPYSIILKSKFSNDDVQFVYLSIDEDRDKWLKFLAEKKAPDGLHYVEKEVGSAFSAFKINGIPRYILIGQDGRIINAYAPGPSSDEIESLIADNL